VQQSGIRPDDQKRPFPLLETAVISTGDLP
jgi:hypothetical protein